MHGFEERHIGPGDQDIRRMLEEVGVELLDQLIDQTIPSSIRLKESLQIDPGLNEYQYLQHIKSIAAKNKVLKSYLGQGYYNCITPTVIQRNVFENPGWYTQYTPYQAEISQGRLEALLTFQTMVSDLTGMEVANASLLDEGTAAAEAMSMIYALVHKDSNGVHANRFFVSDRCYVQTVEVIRSRALPLGIEVVVGDHKTVHLDASYFGAIVQYPDEYGAIHDYRSFIEQAHATHCLVVVAADLLSLALLTPPGEFGVHVVVGNSQRFGVPLGFGGPHAAFFATRKDYVRQMPGRIIGVSIDARGEPAYRMTLQTREQHIRREKATSNICTAQALLAIMAGLYGVYHGPQGIRKIAARIYTLAAMLEAQLKSVGFQQLNDFYFDTLRIDAGDERMAERISKLALDAGYNLRRISKKLIGISLDETTQIEDISTLSQVFATAKNVTAKAVDPNATMREAAVRFPKELQRTASYMQHPVFNLHHSETEMMRFIKHLENRDLSLTHSMIALGSCTMKLNGATELMPVSWPEFVHIHPFAPSDQTEGYRQIFKELEGALCEITGFAAASLQPNSGAQGEFIGLSVIRAYFTDRGEEKRNIALIPSSAHGTNPASAVMAGLNVVVVQCDELGNIDIDDLRAKAASYKESLAALMITYPSTFGVFEEHIKDICALVHENGGQVYMDGANMNAQVGLISPALIGADVCHLNLHKTFAIPHGGGGPGMGPICVASHLAPYLPGHSLVKTGGEKGIHAVASTPWSSASILLISYAYIKMLGGEGLTNATKIAILNANYLKSKLQRHYPVLYEGKNGRVAHEFILNTKPFKQQANVDVEDIAKRLMDYGFHAPTVSFPVPGTLMIEPTESEPVEELDRFVQAMVAIRSEIQEVIDGSADPKDNVLKNAPHTAVEVASDSWSHPYSRAKAVYPLAFLKDHKFWPPVGRINSTYGDRNIMCTCPPIEAYAEAGVQ